MLQVYAIKIDGTYLFGMQVRLINYVEEKYFKLFKKCGHYYLKTILKTMNSEGFVWITFSKARKSHFKK